MPAFTCGDCGSSFNLSDAVLKKFPNWTPKQCIDCRNKGGKVASTPARSTSSMRAKPVAPASADGLGPRSGIFTDGSCQGNPGPGGWGVVVVVDGVVQDERNGYAPQTTNNRMELTATIEGLKLAGSDPVALFTDSNLVVNTLTKWAKGWEAKGWKRAQGPVANLDLVQEAWALLKERPNVSVEWVPGHSGYTWNEYADQLSTAYTRR